MTRKKRKTRSRQERERVYLRGIDGERKAWERKGFRFFVHNGRVKVEQLRPQHAAQFWGIGIVEMLKNQGL